VQFFPTFTRAIAIVGGLLLLTAASLAGDRPDFSGTWQLNEQLSDDPIEVMRAEMQRRRASETMGSMGGRGSGMSGGGMGSSGMGGGGRGGGGAAGQREDPMAAAERLERMNRGAEKLEITQQGSEMRIRYADGRERLFVADGKKHLRESGVGDLQIKAKWKGDAKLVVRSTTEQRHEITEVYEFSPHRTRLHVTISVEGKSGGSSFRFKRVYERFQAEEG